MVQGGLGLGLGLGLVHLVETGGAGSRGGEERPGLLGGICLLNSLRKCSRWDSNPHDKCETLEETACQPLDDIGS